MLNFDVLFFVFVVGLILCELLLIKVDYYKSWKGWVSYVSPIVTLLVVAIVVWVFNSSIREGISSMMCFSTPLFGPKISLGQNNSF